jgi:predicted GTPase
VSKSSIANTSLKGNRVIVSPIARTTHDVVSDLISFGDHGNKYSIRLTDPAELWQKQQSIHPWAFFFPTFHPRD